MIALSLTALMLSGPDATATPPRRYISEFCGPIALSDSDPASVRQRFAEWGARIAPDDAAVSFRPQDADTPGQMVALPNLTDAHVFVERRRGTCSLVYESARLPAAALEDLVAPIGDEKRTLHWRQITTKRVGRPGPIRYVLPVSEDGRFGACATIFEDLRLRDGAPATLVRVETCRLGDPETSE